MGTFCSTVYPVWFYNFDIFNNDMSGIKEILETGKGNNQGIGRMKKININRVILCLLSIILLFFIGISGECLINVAYGGLHGHVGDEIFSENRDIELPAIWDWFPINSNVFTFSLTPFMLLMLGLLGFTKNDKEGDSFWCVFAGIWLFTLIYICMVGIGFTTPFIIPIEVLFKSQVPKIVWVINGVIILTIAFLYIWNYFAKKKESVEEEIK